MRIFKLLFIIFFIGIPMLLFGIAFRAYPGDQWIALAASGSVWFLIGMVVLYLHSRAKANQEHEAHLKQRIAELQKQGADLFYEQNAALTSENVKKVRVTINRLPVIFLLIVLAGSAIIYFNDIGIVGVCIFTIVLLFISYGFYSSAKKFSKIIADGTKTILRGIVTHRYEKYRNNDSDSMKKYFLNIGEREIQVDLATYQKYKIGDAIEIHYVFMNHNASPFVLDHRLLPNAGIPTDQVSK